MGAMGLRVLDTPEGNSRKVHAITCLSYIIRKCWQHVGNTAVEAKVVEKRKKVGLVMCWLNQAYKLL